MTMDICSWLFRIVLLDLLITCLNRGASLTRCSSATNRSEAGMWRGRLRGVHRHGVQVRPRQAAHLVSFVGVTRVTSVVICVNSV